jgi:hypothetical protein
MNEHLSSPSPFILLYLIIRTCHYRAVSIPVLMPAQHPVQWVPGVLSPGLKRGRGLTLTTHPHLVPKSRMSRSYISSPPSASVECSGTALLLLLHYRAYNNASIL